MDVDGLDQWLDDDGDEGRTDEPWRSGGPSAGRTRRPPWRWIALAAVGVWAAVMAVVLAGGGGTGAEEIASDALTPMPDLLQPADDGAVIPAADTPSDVPSEAEPSPMRSPGSEDLVTDDTAASGDEALGSTGWPPGIEAGAVRALRHHLTTQGPPATYLEWATPVAARPLDAGIWVVEVDAVWLEDHDAQLDRARAGVWAVALGDGGQPLGPPWPLADTAPPPPPSEPPTGDVRLPEVQQGLTAHGWQDVTAVAADPHPLLPDVVVALVEGTPPAGDSTIAAVLWLTETADGALAPLGARS